MTTASLGSPFVSLQTDSSVPTPALRATVRLSFACDNACVFCGQDGHPDTPELGGDALENLDLGHLAQLRERHDELTFIGGEPALDARLPKAIASARGLGFSAIGLQTNGWALATKTGLFAELVEAG